MVVSDYGSVIGWAALSVSGLLIGAMLGMSGRFGHGTIARVTALGAGLILAAAAVELAAEAVATHPWSGVTALLGGAATFSAINAWLTLSYLSLGRRATSRGLLILFRKRAKQGGRSIWHNPSRQGTRRRPRSSSMELFKYDDRQLLKCKMRAAGAAEILLNNLLSLLVMNS